MEGCITLRCVQSNGHPVTQVGCVWQSAWQLALCASQISRNPTRCCVLLLLCLRVHTMMLPVLSELSELYRAADGAATACLLAKLGVEKSLMAKLEDTRQALLVGEQPPAPSATAATANPKPPVASACCCHQHHVTH